MKIETMGNSAQNTPQSNQPSSRDRAIAKLLGNSEQPKAPVSNPTSVSAEEMGAIKAPSEESSDFEKAQQAAQAQKHQGDSESNESAPKEETKAAETEEPLSSQYAILARKEKLIRQQAQQLKAREAEIKAKEDAFKSPKESSLSIDQSKYVSKEDLARDPFSILTEMGLTYDQLTELALNGPKPKEIEMMNELKAMKEELKALKGETETTKKSFLDYQNQNESMGINQLTKQATALVNSNPEFETIKETGSIDDVVELIKVTLKQDGVLLSVEEAAQEVENYLLEEALKLAKIKKIQQRLAPKSAPAEAAKTTEQSKQQQLKTLTNSVSSTRPLSSRERAILAMQGKLNK